MTLRLHAVVFHGHHYFTDVDVLVAVAAGSVVFGCCGGCICCLYLMLISCRRITTRSVMAEDVFFGNVLLSLGPSQQRDEMSQKPKVMHF